MDVRQVGDHPAALRVIHDLPQHNSEFRSDPGFDNHSSPEFAAILIRAYCFRVRQPQTDYFWSLNVAGFLECPRAA